MENQGKKKSQMNDSETFVFVAIATFVISILLMFLLGGCASGSSQNIEEEKVLINIDGINVEIVADEYGGQYLKQNTSAGDIYVPYIGPTEEPADTLKFYNTKNKIYANRRLGKGILQRFHIFARGDGASQTGN